MSYTFFSAAVLGIIFMLGKFQGKESFRIEIASPLSICRMFNLSLIITELIQGSGHVCWIL